MDNRKLLVIDTSVLLYDANSIVSFTGNDIIIPFIVLEELDRFKDKQTQTGSNARQVNRFLDNLRSHGSLADGVTVPHTDVVIRAVADTGASQLPTEFESEKGDHKVIAVALSLKNAHPDKIVKVVSKDINLRVKCDSLGIGAEDYYRDLPKSVRDGCPVYSGQSHVITESEVVDSYYQHGRVSQNITQDLLIPNQLIVGESFDGLKSFIGMTKGRDIIKPRYHLHTSVKIEPKSKEQRAALHLLTDDDVPLVSITGLAGSGKTFLALISAISGLQDKKYDRIIITRSIEPVGRDLGFLPGSLDEKMAPWIMPIIDNYRAAFGDTTFFEMMRQRGSIEVSPITYIRGRSFTKSIVIVDECQNLTIHELKTIITRAGQGTKIILLGDTEQIDTPYMDRYSNGLSIAIERLKGQELFGHIHLDKGERSALATLGSNVL